MRPARVDLFLVGEFLK